MHPWLSVPNSPPASGQFFLETGCLGARTGAEVLEDALHRLNEGTEIATDRFQNTDPAIPEFVKARTGYLLETLYDTN